MGDDDFDELDDWSETEEWDDSDTWDDADDEAVAYGWDDEESDEAEHWDRGGFGIRVEEAQPQERRTLSAGDFGTGVAVAGWLLDRHAEKITEAVRAAATPGQAPGVTKPAWTRLEGAPFDLHAEPLQPGERLERSRLQRVLAEQTSTGGDLVLEARPIIDAGPPRPGSSLDWSALRFTILHSPLVDRLPLWVLFDERDGGFVSAWLLPVFADTGPPGRAYCYVDSATRAVHVIEWGLDRHALRLDDFRWQLP